MFVSESQKSKISIILLDEDPIFPLGLKEIFKDANYQDINIIATGKPQDLKTLVKEYNPSLWLLVLDFERYPKKADKILNYLTKLAIENGDLKLVLLLTPRGLNLNIENISIIKGYFYKNIDIEELVNTLRLTAEGKIYSSLDSFIASNEGFFSHWLWKQCYGGINKIEQEIQGIKNYTEARELSLIDVIYWQGRQRELKLAKWLIKSLLPQKSYTKFSYSNEDVNDSLLKEKKDKKITQNDNNNDINSLKSSIVLPRAESLDNYDLIITQITNSLENCTNTIQEIDILKNTKKQELLTIIIQEWIKLLDELKISDIYLEELNKKTDILLQEMWRNSSLKFLSRYLLSDMNKQENEDNDNNLVNLLFQKNQFFLRENNNLIPFVSDIIASEIKKKEIIIDNKIYPFHTEETQEIKLIILNNMIINMANYVMAFILNNFYDNLSIKHSLFKSELKSSRKVAMFRNNLVWKYRREKYWLNPHNIFEDRYMMFKLTAKGIETCYITHSRHQELKEIKGIPWGVTILIELRDSLAKGVKALGDSAGKLLVYLLTEVIGKAIGLIGKGILQGIGSRLKN